MNYFLRITSTTCEGCQSAFTFSLLVDEYNFPRSGVAGWKLHPAHDQVIGFYHTEQNIPICHNCQQLPETYPHRPRPQRHPSHDEPGRRPVKTAHRPVQAATLDDILGD